MTLKVYGLVRVLRKSKTTIKNNRIYVKLTLLDLKSQKNNAIIESVCFKRIDQRKLIQDIKTNSIMYIDGKLELSPKRIVSSSFAIMNVKDKSEVITDDSINDKIIAYALKKAQENINIIK